MHACVRTCVLLHTKKNVFNRTRRLFYSVIVKGNIISIILSCRMLSVYTKDKGYRECSKNHAMATAVAEFFRD